MDTKFDMSNHPIEAAFAAFRMEPSKNNLLKVLTSIQGYAIQDGQFLIPVELPQAAFNMITPRQLKPAMCLRSKRIYSSSRCNYR